MNISRAFYDWVRECHENHDKQVMLAEMKMKKNHSSLGRAVAKVHKPRVVVQAYHFLGRSFSPLNVLACQMPCK